MKKILSVFLVALLTVLPGLSFAQTTEELDAAYDAAVELIDMGYPGRAYPELLKLADQGYAPALYAIGYELDIGEFNNGTPDHEAAAQWWSKAAELGEIKSLQALGHYYAHDAATIDFVKAEEWLLKAAEVGLSGAMHNLANHYMTGDFGGASDPERARMWYVRAAEAGNENAMNSAIDLCANGKISETGEVLLAPDYEALFKVVQLGYEKGSANTKVYDWLGWIFAGNSGIMEADYTRAQTAYMAGAELGSGYCMAQLGAMYRDGRLGVSDLVAAQSWFTQAVEAGYEPAQEMLDSIKTE